MEKGSRTVPKGMAFQNIGGNEANHHFSDSSGSPGKRK
jgi:hypothetical protein